MVSTFTPNIQLEEPARGDDVGTWDVPVNNNMTLIDLVAGGIATISLNNSPVVLSAAQYEAKGITFNSTLTGSVSITFPSSFKKSYEIYHTCTGSSAFTITLTTTVAGGEVVCAPPGEIVDVVNDGTNIRYKNLGRIGSYWDYAGSSVPSWVSGCTKPPYLNCDGTAFSSATYPQLAVVLGSVTVPDSRGRVRAVLNQGTNRMLLGNGGVDGNTIFAAGGVDIRTVGQANLPNINLSGAGNPVVGSFQTSPDIGFLFQIGGTQGAVVNVGVAGTYSHAINITASAIAVPLGGSGSPLSDMQPTLVGGLTLIRAG